MPESNRRGTFVLYVVIALAILVAVFSGAVVPPVGAALITLYLLALTFSARRFSLQNLRAALPSQAPRITNAARKATERAATGFLHAPYTLQDLGIIIDERRPDGIGLRWARFITLDDESLRPYVVLHVPSEEYADQVIVRFALHDGVGTPQFIYEMEYRLSVGENLILPDYRLPLEKNAKLKDTDGTWQYTISIDGQPLGTHPFSLLPSVSQRLKQAKNDGEVDHSTRLMVEEMLPVSLEELLNR